MSGKRRTELDECFTAAEGEGEGGDGVDVLVLQGGQFVMGSIYG